MEGKYIMVINAVKLKVYLEMQVTPLCPILFTVSRVTLPDAWHKNRQRKLVKNKGRYCLLEKHPQ